MKLNKFNEFLFDKIFENKNEICIILSDNLKNLLKKIDHPISKEMLMLETEQIKSDKITLIDLDYDDFKKLIYTIPSKVVDYFEKEVYNFNRDTLKNSKDFKLNSIFYSDIWSKYKTSTSVSKVVEKIFPKKYDPSGKPGEDRESFQNMIVATRKKLLNPDTISRFKIVKGKDINKYYSEDSFTQKATTNTTLNQSCMKYDKCSKYIDFYSKNDGVELIVLMSDISGEEDKISARALLWDIEYIDDVKVKRKFMDRIYYVNEDDVYLFKDLAKENKWLYKLKQESDWSTEIVDTLHKLENNMSLKTTSTFNESTYYPYLDTLVHYYPLDGFLSNSDEYGIRHHFLIETDGGPINTDTEGMVYVSYYGDYIDEDVLIWCEYGEDWRKPRDSVNILRLYNAHATDTYAKNNMAYSNDEDSYILEDDAVWSKYRNDLLYEPNTIKFFGDGAAELDSMEELLEDSDIFEDYAKKSDLIYFFSYEYMNENYWFIDYNRNYFVLATSLKNQKETKWLHKKWDDDKIFIHKGIYYIDDDDISKDELIK